MPIDTKELRKVETVPGGVRVQEVHTDTLGVEWGYNYVAASEIAATAIMNGRDLSDRLKRRDYEDCLQWVQDGNTVQDFVVADRDVTKLQCADWIIAWFSRAPGEDAITVCWLVDATDAGTWTSVCDRLGFTLAERNRIKTRANTLLAAEPDFDYRVDAPNG